MFALCLVELQCRSQGVEHAFRCAGEVAALHADVVVDGHPGQHRDLLASQPLDSAVAAVGRESGLLRGDARPP